MLNKIGYVYRRLRRRDIARPQNAAESSSTGLTTLRIPDAYPQGLLSGTVAERRGRAQRNGGDGVFRSEKKEAASLFLCPSQETCCFSHTKNEKTKRIKYTRYKIDYKQRNQVLSHLRVLLLLRGVYTGTPTAAEGEGTPACSGKRQQQRCRTGP